MMKSVETVAVTRAHETGASNTFRLVDDPPVFVRGDGAWLFTAEGRPMLDLACGSSTTALGHGHPAHRAAVEAVMATGILHTGTRLPSPFRAALYEALASRLPPGLDVVHLANAGTEATEIALKAAQYATGRRRFVCFEGGYHGRTTGALSVTAGPRIRSAFTLLDDRVDVMPYPARGEGPAAVDAALALLSARLAAAKAAGDPIAALIVEAVQGVAGVREAEVEFLAAAGALARDAGALVIADEIWTGFGRAGRMFAFERAGLTPDLVTLGKALSSGPPLSAVAGPADILKRWPPGMHTSTFQGNPLSCAVATATLEALDSARLVERAASVIEPALARGLGPLRNESGVAALRVIGAQAAIDFGPGGATRAAAVQRAALGEGYLLYGGGASGECVMLLPPLVVGIDDLANACAAVVRLVRATR
jgi:4-aminobutyrate aminotransferase-like enzyme